MNEDKKTKKHIIMAVLLAIGAGLGYSFLPTLWSTLGMSKQTLINNPVTDILIGVILFLVISLLFTKRIIVAIRRAEYYLSKQSPIYLLFGSLALILGLVLANVISIPFYQSNIWLLKTFAPIVLMIILGYLGFRVGTTRLEEWRKLFQFQTRKRNADSEDVLERRVGDNYHQYKILDTSVIIDGRIYEIAKTGFIEGTLLIPNFVLYELQFIADSGDSLKRVRGRRGLDILNSLQNEASIPVEMYEGDFEDIQEVDTKLIKLAKMLDGVVVTNDYNLNKVTEFQNVPVLNINELANTLKPVVIPGETMKAMVVKAGTERKQGVAYLDDGTMIVVEDGQYFMNESIEVIVTSALQTAAGRMIFAKPAHAQKGIK